MIQQIKDYAAQHQTLLFDTLKQLCAIPAPSGMEQQRAAYCKEWLERAGATGVYIDAANNVVFPLCCDGSDRITVLAAHTDTVFPDTEPMPYLDDGEKIYCPGVADDTASVAVLLLTAKYFIDHRINPENGILFVCNSCEEGLGNLKGTRQLFADFDGRISAFVTLDSTLDTVCDRCVGSHRYEVQVQTCGGHSFAAFGNPNAIAQLSDIVHDIYQIQVPGANTTYNVGLIEGGTSVNTIAQNASMLCEYRSADKQHLAFMQARFDEIFAAARARGVQLTVTKVGDRPCADIDEQKIEQLKQRLVPHIRQIIGKPVRFAALSTDCNLPLSLGIPALCVGVSDHAGIHTREEWLSKASLLPGLEIAIRLGLALM